MVKIIGAGLAGSEIAWYLANQGIKVKLYEMRPLKKTPVHQTGFFAELVCSNSLRSDDINNAVGLLKAEMRLLDSLILQAATHTQVPAGSSLAVDRTLFSQYITDKIKSHPLIEVINEEVTTINDQEITVIAAGPLASETLTQTIINKIGDHNLYFFDAVAPIIEKDSIDMSIAYIKDRYDKSDNPSYINCPMTKEEYLKFYHELINAQKVIPKDFENNVFEGCMPVEVMASRGIDTLLFGPLKPVGLEKDLMRPYAVVQLRQDDAAASMYNMVGFQTHMTFSEQKRIIQMIPGLQKANILRYGVIHKNTYINASQLLNATYQVKTNPNLFFVGQIAGVEGYVESAASALACGIAINGLLKQKKVITLPPVTMIGAMAHYISTPNKSFVPMNANFGLMPNLENAFRKKALRKEAYATRSLQALKEFIEVLK